MSGSGGEVRQRPNETWEGRYYTPDRRRHSVYAKTKAEAQAKLRAALSNAGQGIRPTPQRLTVAAYLEEWLETSVRPRCRPRTFDSYRETVARYIAPNLGRLALGKLEPTDIAKMLTRLGDQGLSPTTVRYSYSILRIALGRAVKQGKVLRNACTLVDPPARVRVELHPLSADQAVAFIEATRSDRLGPLYAVAIATGMRQGELLGLRWSDVDLETGILAVRHTLRRGDRALAEPKTERGRRTLRLGAEAVIAQREQRRRQLEERLASGRKWADRDLVFASSIGTALDSRHVTQALQRALARTGLPRQRFHDLRHAYATLMLEDGEELAIVSRSLGHSDLSTTADVYAHLTPAMLERSAARMDGILRRVSGQ